MKAVAVTGGCGGLGSAVCEYFASKGIRVFALDIGEKDLENENITYIKLDVTSEESVNAAFAAVSALTDRLDAVIHLAGVYMMDAYAEMSEERFKRILDINLLGVFRVNKAFLPLLRNGGRVMITTSEVAPIDPLPFNGIYSLSKTALDSYAQSLRLELALLDIPVVIIQPGAFSTGLIGESDIQMRALCERTKLYKANSAKFREIMDRVTTKALPPVELAKLIYKAFSKKRPKFVYSKNRSFLLRLYSAMPTGIQVFALKTLLK